MSCGGFFCAFLTALGFGDDGTQLPDPEDPRFRLLEEKLRIAEKEGLSLADKAFIVVHELQAVSMQLQADKEQQLAIQQLALQVSNAIPTVIESNTPNFTTQLSLAMQFKARSLNCLNRSSEANEALIMSEHLTAIAGQQLRILSTLGQAAEQTEHR